MTSGERAYIMDRKREITESYGNRRMKKTDGKEDSGGDAAGTHSLRRGGSRARRSRAGPICLRLGRSGRPGHETTAGGRERSK